MFFIPAYKHENTRTFLGVLALHMGSSHSLSIPMSSIWVLDMRQQSDKEDLKKNTNKAYILFCVLCMTHDTKDHILSHCTMESYKQLKKKVILDCIYSSSFCLFTRNTFFLKRPQKCFCMFLSIWRSLPLFLFECLSKLQVGHGWLLCIWWSL